MDTEHSTNQAPNDEATAPEPVDEATDPQENVDEPQENVDEPKTFDESYVKKLRDENAKYRQRAQRADELARELFTARVAATGRLADPTDLAYSDEALDDPDKLTQALDELLARKPHLANRRPRGDVGQGVASSSANVDLAAILRGRA